MKRERQKILVVLGPTASGKSALVVLLALKFGGEIISADSRQVYKGLDIGTGKITKKEMRGVRHHLLDVEDPRRQFTVVQYVEKARRAIAAIARRGKLPIICGGAGFYISAVVDNLALPKVPPNKNLRAELRGKTSEALFATLLKLDPRRAKTLDAKNPRRIIRAIEVAQALGKVPDRQPSTNSQEPYEYLFIGLRVPPQELKRKILIRLLARMRRGMVREARKLHGQGLSWKRMNELGLEYRYLAKYLRNEMSKSEMIQKLGTEIWHYTKRQMTWFKRDPRIKWFSPKDFKAIEKEIAVFLRT